MPNNFAYIALLSWPVISLLFFYRHMPIVQATFWTIVGGFLFLPVKTAIDFPFIPPLDKESIPVIAALIGCRYIKKAKIKLLPNNGIERWLVLLLLITPIFTTLNNQELFNGIPGLTFHDAISAIINQYLLILPFVIGMQIIKTHEDQLALFKSLILSFLIYSVPILFEVRMSPQLHTWVYGFFPHDFVQQYRFGGYRSMVFLGHGLSVAMFVVVCLAAASIFLKEKIKVFGIPLWLTLGYVFFILVLSKTVGAFVLGTFLIVSIIWLPTRAVRWLSLSLGCMFILYPILSISNLFPHETILQLARDFDETRGNSLESRFFHEGLLLEHARNKLWFGWGEWGRNRLSYSVTDGYWIIIFGKYGLVGFLSFFGLIFLSAIRAIKISKVLYEENEKSLLLNHAILVSVIMIDQLPNASLSAWLLLLSGALLGRVNYIRFARNI